MLSKKMVRLRLTARKSVPGGPYRVEGFRLPEQDMNPGPRDPTLLHLQSEHRSTEDVRILTGLAVDREPVIGATLSVDEAWSDIVGSVFGHFPPSDRFNGSRWLVRHSFSEKNGRTFPVYRPNRVLRQFGMFQHIPDNPEFLSDLHRLTLQGNVSVNWVQKHQPSTDVWKSRLNFICESDMIDGASEDAEYYNWYIHSFRRFHSRMGALHVYVKNTSTYNILRTMMWILSEDDDDNDEDDYDDYGDNKVVDCTQLVSKWHVKARRKHQGIKMRVSIVYNEDGDGDDEEEMKLRDCVIGLLLLNHVMHSSDTSG
ncbi:hypothetical protein AgCh_039754 [Apium graveolens]